MRFLAALVVFLSHISGDRFTAGFLWQFGRFGGEAVNVFFVLSGFVIAYVIDKREQSVGDYMVSRAARIYSVALPALLLTFALDAVGRAAYPALYSAAWGYSWADRLPQFLSGLFFLNQLWFNQIAPGSDLPYWSLGYEVWYYALFGVLIFAPRRWRMAGIMAILALIGPRLIALFPIWFLGVICYRICSRVVIGRFLGYLLCFGGLAAWVAYETYVWTDGIPLIHNAMLYALTHNELIADDYAIGGLFAVHLVGFNAISPDIGRILIKLQTQIRWIAGATFSLYLFHLPVAQFLAAETPWPPASWPNRVLLYLGTFLIVLLLAEFTERRKEIWRRGFSGLLRTAKGLLNEGTRYARYGWASLGLPSLAMLKIRPHP